MRTSLISSTRSLTVYLTEEELSSLLNTKAGEYVWVLHGSKWVTLSSEGIHSNEASCKKVSKVQTVSGDLLRIQCGRSEKTNDLEPWGPTEVAVSAVTPGVTINVPHPEGGKPPRVMPENSRRRVGIRVHTEADRRAPLKALVLLGLPDGSVMEASLPLDAAWRLNTLLMQEFGVGLTTSERLVVNKEEKEQ